jgi:hypothetical protein
MTSTEKTLPRIQYSPRTIHRAERAVKCAPFQIRLFETMRWQSVKLSEIAGTNGVKHGYLRRSLSELAVENDLLWLIETGLLRREVDGQGLTDSFRLTPLGHQLVERWQHQGRRWLRPSLLDYLSNAVSRWVRLPAWLQ